MSKKSQYHSSTFWLEDNTTELTETGIECPECGSELMFNDNFSINSFHIGISHSVKCSNDNCNYRDKLKVE